MENKVVVHLKNGEIHKGITHDFDPEEEAFHLLPAEGGGVPLRLEVEEMKALFYVKDYLGDGEVVYGVLPEFNEQGRGFFLVPTDPDDNNVRIFVVRSSVQRLEFPS
jgi:hypothetical protein